MDAPTLTVDALAEALASRLSGRLLSGLARTRRPEGGDTMPLPDGVFRKRGRLWISYQCASATGGKHQRRQPAGTDDPLEAARIREARARGAVTLGEHLDRYEAQCKHQKSYASFKAWRIKSLRRLAALPLSSLTTALVRQYQVDRLAEGLSEATVNRDLAVLANLLRLGVDDGLVGPEILAAVRKVKALPEQKRLRYLSGDEVTKLLAHCGTVLSSIVRVALHTGMRKGEILHLRWQDVDLANRRVTLTDAKAGPRYVHLSAEAVEALRAAPPQHLTEPWVYHEGGVRLNDCKKAFRTAVTKAKLAGVCFYVLRHTFGSHMAMVGAHQYAIQEALGHKSPRMTARYVHLAPNAADEYLGRLYQAADEAVGA